MAESTATGTRIIGSLRTAEGTGIVRMEDRFDTTIDDLWTAFVDPDRLVRWLGRFEGDLRLGGEFRARYWASGWEGTGRVEACEPPHHLLVRTTSADANEEHFIEAWLQAEQQQTLVTIEERGMPLNLLAAYGAGVQIHVEDLAHHLAGEQRCDPKSRWSTLMPSYEEQAAHFT